MKKTLILISLLTACHSREDISKRENCLFHNYKKLPYCKSYNFLPADKGENITKINKEENVIPVKYSKNLYEDPNYDLMFEADPILAN